MSTENWRIPVDASVILGGNKKRVEIEQRRPAIRNAADLVGPGIGAAATRITDYNNLLATFNGYYSSAPGASSAPNSTDSFVGQVVSDALLGGRQVFTSLTTGAEYARVFTRSPTDPETIGWGAWTGQRVIPTLTSFSANLVVVEPGSATILQPPNIGVSGDESVFEYSDVGIRVKKQGVYTGAFRVVASTLATTANVTIQMPTGLTSPFLQHDSQQHLGAMAYYPFTCFAWDELQGFSVSVYHSEASARIFWWMFQCARVGDAV